MEKIGYLGPEGSYSFVAVKSMLPDALPCAYQNFTQVFASLTSGKTDGIIIPVENSLNGEVAQNLDLLQTTENVVAVGEIIIKITHRLGTLKGADKSKIKRIYSHGEALEQCAKYLSENFPPGELCAVDSTSASAKMVKTYEDACIAGSHITVEGLEFSEDDIADGGGNFTHFLLVRQCAIPEHTHSERIFFSVTCPNKPGALLTLLQCVSSRGLNMTKIESRPIKDASEESTS